MNTSEPPRHADATAIVPAAGRGTRFGAARNKVLEPLLGRPILRWTLEALAAADDIDEIIVAVSPEDADEITIICQGLSCPCRIVPGGAMRQDSVRNALREATRPIVAVHDAARPLVTPEIIARGLASARAHGTGIVAMPVADTLKRQADQVVLETIPREDFWGAQVAGLPVRLVPGSPQNIKITTPDDLVLADAILRARRAGKGAAVTVPRIGYGYDVHRFAEGRRMVLGGVDFGLDYGLLGHSDADTLLHAVMDALLGAAGLPDIGHLFPNTDERWNGADSMDLLAEVVRRIRAEGLSIGNLDTTVIAERPKIAPHAPAMRANIARACGIPESSVGLKATTHEGLGALGAGEGLAAHAVCLLIPEVIGD